MAHAGNCPNCGAALEETLATTKMRDCTHCETTIFLADDGMRSIGTRGVMLDAPSLFRLGCETIVAGIGYTPVGHARFDYGAGWWDEYWCQGPRGMLWLSVDEGDIAIEAAIEAPPGSFTPTLGRIVKIGPGEDTYKVVEVENATCIAVRGELPEVLFVGETHLYADLAGPDGAIVTFEQWTDDGATQTAWFRGDWLDPYDAETGGAP